MTSAVGVRSGWGEAEGGSPESRRKAQVLLTCDSDKGGGEGSKFLQTSYMEAPEYDTEFLLLLTRVKFNTC